MAGVAVDTKKSIIHNAIRYIVPDDMSHEDYFSQRLQPGNPQIFVGYMVSPSGGIERVLQLVGYVKG